MTIFNEETDSFVQTRWSVSEYKFIFAAVYLTRCELTADGNVNLNLKKTLLVWQVQTDLCCRQSYESEVFRLCKKNRDSTLMVFSAQLQEYRA